MKQTTNGHLMLPPQPQPVTLTAQDGYLLKAFLYPASAAPRGHILMTGATGVPRTFYRSFAAFAATQGYSTLTLDYRGIGESKPTDLQGFKMDYLDWAHKDIACAVDYLARHRDMPLFYMGHSFGGHALGLLPNHSAIARAYTFGTGAGWHGWMPWLEQVKVQLMWKVVGPVLVWWKGYLAWSKLGMGEDLPLGVYRDWKRWCKFPRYFFDDPAHPAMAEQFAKVTVPNVAVNALDDLWAKPASRDAFMSAYVNAPLRCIDVDATAMGTTGIGHMGYFRRSAQPLWADALAWFGEHPARQST